MGLTTGFNPLTELVNALTADGCCDHDEGSSESATTLKHQYLRQTPSKGILWVIRRIAGTDLVVRDRLTLYDVSYSRKSGYWGYRVRYEEEGVFDKWLVDIPKDWGVPPHWDTIQRVYFLLGERSAAQIENEIAARPPKPEGDRNGMDHDEFFGSLKKLRDRATQ